MNEQEAYLTGYYWLASSWLKDEYLGLEDEVGTAGVADPVRLLLNRMQPAAKAKPQGDDQTWQAWRQAVMTVPTNQEGSQVKLVLPTAVQSPTLLSEMTAYTSLAIFLQQRDEPNLQRLGQRVATQSEGAAWELWQAHHRSMNPEAAPATLTTDQLKAVVWVFFAKYSVAGDPFDIDDLLPELEAWQTESDEDLDTKWQTAIVGADTDGKIVTLEQGLVIALTFFNLVEWGGDLAIKATLQNKLTQRGLDGNLNSETVANWEAAWRHWDDADIATVESWAVNILDPDDEAADATFEDDDDPDEDEYEDADESDYQDSYDEEATADDDYDDDDYDDEDEEDADSEEVKPAWKVGMSYATVFIVFRIVMWAMVSPGHLPALALAGDFSNKWMLIGVSLLLMFIGWAILTIIVTLLVLIWRFGKSLINR